MRDTLERWRRGREMLITVSFTLFSAMMIVVATKERWPFFYLPLLMIEIFLSWMSYVKKIKTYQFRAFFQTALVTLNMFLYGIQAEDFFVVIPTLCVEFVLLSLYELPRIMDIVLIKSAVLFLYHILFKSYTFPTDQLVQSRITLQFVSYLVLIGLSLHRIYHHQQREAEMKLLRNQLDYEKIFRNDLVSNISHELRTPINSISGFSEILLRKELPADTHKTLQEIQMVSMDLEKIITDILDFNDLKSGSIILSPRIYSTTSFLNDIMNMVVYENRSKQLEIILDFDPNIPRELEGDENQLRRAIQNLVSNAVKYTAEGGIILKVTSRSETYGINLIVSVRDTGVGIDHDERELILGDFYQSDMGRSREKAGIGLGIPIAAALVKKMGGFLLMNSEKGVGSEFIISVPQKVVDSNASIALLHAESVKVDWYSEPGSDAAPIRDAFTNSIQHLSEALNLEIHRNSSLEELRQRIRRNQTTHLFLGEREYMQDRAYFDLVSEKTNITLLAEYGHVPGAGARIRVLLKPYNAFILAELINSTDQSPVPASRRRRERSHFRAPSARILAVDDNQMNLKVLEGLLRKYQIQVVTSSSGKEALSRIESQDYDLVFMDHMMPGMDGVECLRRIREKEGDYFRQIPIIALTANAVAGSREKFLAEGFDEFVAKPMELTALDEVLHRFIPGEKKLSEESGGEKAAETNPR